MSRDQPRSAHEKFKAEGAVRYDLARPPTAQDLGVAEGRTSAIFDRGSGDPLWDIKFTLPGGTVWTTKAFAVAVAVEPPGATLGNEIVVNARADNAEDLRRRLLADAPVLGLNVEQVNSWVTELIHRPLTTSNSSDTIVFRARTFDYLTVSVEARARREVETISVNYKFYWNPFVPDGAKTPSPTSTPS